MTSTVPVHMRWPKPLVERLKEVASRRHSTFSELTRQAVIAHYGLDANSGNGRENDSKTGAEGEIE